jgi:uncharacterized protein
MTNVLAVRPLEKTSARPGAPFFVKILQRLASYGRGSDRVVGIDAARGLAVLGMVGAHVLLVDAFQWDQPSTWLDVVNGRSSILFAVLAGLSVAIISRRGVNEGGVDLVHARVRIATRAILIFAIGGVLAAAGTGFPIILATYSVLFVGAIPILSWRPRQLVGLAVGVVVVAPALVYFARSLRDASDGVYLSDAFSELMITGEFPAAFWFGFLLVGLAVGRMHLTAVRIQLALLVIGTGAAVVGYRLADASMASIETWGFDPDVQDLLWALSYPGAHSGSTTEAIASGGLAVAIIGACLLLANVRIFRLVLFPVAAVGSMALTAYVGHFAVIRLSTGWADYTSDPAVFGLFALGMMAACSILWIVVGRGPLEYLLTKASNWAARTPAAPLDPARTSSDARELRQ